MFYPELAAIEEHFEGQPVTVIGVHAPEFSNEADLGQVQQAIERHKIRHAVLQDVQHQVWKQWDVRSWPTVVVLDTQGRLAWSQPGEVERYSLIATIDRLLAEGRETQTIAETSATKMELPNHTASLRFPGKVRMWPSSAGQEMGRSPFDEEARLYVSDTGNHRL